MKRNVRVCLSWHNLNSSNYGVSALAVAQVKLVLNAAEAAGVNVSLTTLGTTDLGELPIRSEVEKRFGIEIEHIDYTLKQLVLGLMRFDFKLLKVFDDFDLVMDIGEGDSFTDIYGMLRFFTLSVTKIIPLARGKRVILSPQTIGPFKSAISRSLAKIIMKYCDVVFSRDFKTSGYLATLGVDCIDVSDVAFTLPFDKRKIDADSVGINISGLLWNGGYTGDNQFGLKLNYKDLIDGLIDGFLARGKKVYLVAHVICQDLPVEDDYQVCEKLAYEFSGKGKAVYLAPRFSSPIEAKTYISGLAFFAGSRMHATIAALSSGVPTIPIAYSRKFSGVFGSLGYEYSLNAYELNLESLHKQFFFYVDECFNRMKEDVVEAIGVAETRNKNYVQYIAQVLGDE